MFLDAFEIRPGHWGSLISGYSFQNRFIGGDCFPSEQRQVPGVVDHRHKTENVRNVSHAGPPHRLNLTSGDHEQESPQFPSADILGFVCRSRDDLRRSSQHLTLTLALEALRGGPNTTLEEITEKGIILCAGNLSNVTTNLTFGWNSSEPY